MEQVERVLAVRELMRSREKARKDSDFDESDRIRNELKDSYGVKVIDQKDGPSGWKFLDGSSNKIDPSKSNLIPKDATSNSNNLSKESGNKRKGSNEESDDANATTKIASKDSNKKTKQEDTKKATPIKPIVPSKAVVSESERNKQLVANIVQNQTKTTNGILIEDLAVGKGSVIATSGHRLKMYYVGKLKTTNKVFDSATKKPFSFRLGRGEVIKGWDIGVAGMREGGKRRLTIPPEKAYGRSGAPPAIPGNATLVFEVTLLQIA